MTFLRLRQILTKNNTRIAYTNFAGIVTHRSASSRTHTQYEVKNNVAIFRYSTPSNKINAINQDAIDETQSFVDEVNADPSVKAVVVTSSKPGCFVAGVDLKWMEECQSDKEEAYRRALSGQIAVTGMTQVKKPFVAAIHGICLGAGLEISLACDYRICVDSPQTVFGLPEFMLGLLPGCGGTQRLPAQISWLKALDLFLSGKTLRPAQAKKLGIVDQVVPSLGPGIKDADQRTLEYLEEIAIKTALDIAEGRLKIKRDKPLQDRLFNQALQFAPFRNYILKKAELQVLAKTHGLYPGPIKILDVLRKTLENGEKAGFEAELNAFTDLWYTNESRGLRSLYHGQTKCKKNRFGQPERTAQNIAVLGAGLMGAGIAQVSLTKGLNVVLKDTTTTGLARGEGHIQKALEKQVKRKRLTNIQRDQITSRLTTSLTNEKLAKSDIVIEAVFEDLELKRRIVKEIEAVTPDHCIFATNTSALPLADIAQASQRPEKFIGMHYFSPVDKMQLLEIVITDQTSKDTIASAVELGIKQGKVPIVVRDCPGFYTTRLAGTLYSEGGRMLQEGEDPKKLDKMCRAAGFPFGIVTLYDEIGLDVSLHVGRYFEKVYGERLGGANMQGVADMIDNGFLGRKSGKGFFIYSGNSKNRPVNEEAMKLLTNYRQTPKGLNSPDDIKLRLMTRFTNEAIRCLQENVLDSPVEGDVGAVFGLGFPPFTGGPFRFTDTFGANKLVAQLEKYQAAYGAPFEPCDLLKDYAKNDTKFYNASISPIY